MLKLKRSISCFLFDITVINQDDLCVSLQTVRHGFPYQPTALAFDPVQKILAIGSRSGGVRMYPLLPVHSPRPHTQQ